MPWRLPYLYDASDGGRGFKCPRAGKSGILRPRQAVPCSKYGAQSTVTTLKALQEVLRATQFAAERHAQQRRKGAAGEPYVNHVIEVAGLVATALEEPDTNLVMAALLHDTIEDTATTEGELIERFGSDVAGLVVELTDDKSLPKAERKRLQVEHAHKKSKRAQMIKSGRQNFQPPEHSVEPAGGLGLRTQAAVFRVGQTRGGRTHCAQPDAEGRIRERVEAIRRGR